LLLQLPFYSQHLRPKENPQPEALAQEDIASLQNHPIMQSINYHKSNHANFKKINHKHQEKVQFTPYTSTFRKVLIGPSVKVEGLHEINIT
jgi:hypothetical protein